MIVFRIDFFNGRGYAIYEYVNLLALLYKVHVVGNLSIYSAFRNWLILLFVVSVDM